MEKNIDPGEGWRLLEPGEKVHKCEEVFVQYPGKWVESGNCEGDCEQSFGMIYRRRIDAAEPQWHDDEAPTEKQVGNDKQVLVTWENGCLGLTDGMSARKYWHAKGRPCVIAWSFPPAPYQPSYAPPSTWQRTADRPPTKADGPIVSTDANNPGRVLDNNWEHVTEHPNFFPEWIPAKALRTACRD